MRPKLLCLALVVACALAFALYTPRATSAAATFTVNDTGDTSDANAGDGACADSTGKCTLRAAIEEANALAGDDTINFSVKGIINLTGPSTTDSATALVINSNVEINGPGANLLTVRRDSGGNYRILSVSSGATVNISGLTIADGHAPDNSFAVSGGGIHNAGTLTLELCTVSGNKAGDAFEGGDGGGIYNAGTLSLENSTVSGNNTGHGSGDEFVGGRGGRGGGIYNASGTLELTNSTVSDNTTGNGGFGGLGGGNGGFGGGIYNAFGTLELTNCTISGNTTGNGGAGGGVLLEIAKRPNVVYGDVGSAGSGGDGGGIFNDFVGTLTIINSTISDNTTGSGGPIFTSPLSTRKSTNSTDVGGGNGNGGGISNADGGTANLGSTIVAGNTTTGIGPDLSGVFTSQGYNLIGDSTGSNFVPGNPNPTNDIVGDATSPINPLLDPLDFYGGPTKTHRLQTGSPAIDKGQTTLTTDQRGAERPYDYPDVPDATDGDASDIGAFELQPLADVKINKQDTLDPVLAGGTVTYVLRASNEGPDDAHNVIINDTLPAGLTNVAIASIERFPATIVGFCGVTGLSVNCAFDNLPAVDPESTVVPPKGGKVRITITATAQPATRGLLVNTATVSADEFDPDTSDNTDGERTTVVGVSSVEVTPDTVPGGATCGQARVKVTLSNAAPGDVFVELSDDLAATTNIPDSTSPLLLRVPEGQTSAALLVETTQVSSAQTGQVTAELGTSSASDALTVRPIMMKKLVLSQSSVTGGSQVTGTVFLECAVGPPGFEVTLTTGKPAVASFIHPTTNAEVHPLTLLIENSSQGTFTIQTHPVTDTVGVNVRARAADGTTRNARLNVLGAVD